MIEYITYKKKKYPVRISYGALKSFAAETGVEFGTADPEGKGFNIADYEILLYHALRYGHKAMDQEMPFKKDDMEYILDECFMEFVALIPKFFPEGSAMGEIMAAGKK